MKHLLLILLMLPAIFMADAQYNEDINNKLFKDHKGEILFSQSMMDLKDMKEESFQKEFTLQDNIYAQVILEKPLSKVYLENDYAYDFTHNKFNYNYALIVKVDGEKEAQWYFELPENFFKHSVSFDQPVITDKPQTKRDHSDFVNDFVNVLSTMGKGTHTVNMEVVPMNVEIVGRDVPVAAEGSFEIKIEPDQIETFREEKTTDLPPVTITSPRLEARILQASDKVYPYADPLRAFITDVNEGWTYSADEYGNIRSRKIVASVVYQIHTNDKCWVKTGMYTQQHQGYGEFGPLVHYTETEGYYDYEVPCRKVDLARERTLSVNE